MATQADTRTSLTNPTASTIPAADWRALRRAVDRAAAAEWRAGQDVNRAFDLKKKRDAKSATARARLDAAEELHDAAVKARSIAERALLFAPAPDLAAVQCKLEMLFGDAEIDGTGPDAEIPLWPREYTDALIADVRRLGESA